MLAISEKAHKPADVTPNANNVEHSRQILERVKVVEGVEVIHVSDRTFDTPVTTLVDVADRI